MAEAEADGEGGADVDAVGDAETEGDGVGVDESETVGDADGKDEPLHVSILADVKVTVCTLREFALGKKPDASRAVSRWKKTLFLVCRLPEFEQQKMEGSVALPVRTTELKPLGHEESWKPLPA